jgi:NhaC family Na+:H+ antiporter
MAGMLLTVFLIIAAATFGGAMVGSGMLQSLTNALVSLVHGRVSMVASSVATGIFANMVTGDQYLSIILTSSLYKKLYKDRGYESKLLSRSVEDSATVTSVVIPWNSCGMTQATVLKVATLDYLPYCLFNLISPLMSIIIAALGYKIVRKSK